MNSKLSASALLAVSELFRVLAEPTRLAILQVLQDRPYSVGELVEQLNAKQANISKQLGILHDARLLTREREGNVVNYSIGEPMVFELCRLVCGKLKRDAEQGVMQFHAAAKSRPAVKFSQKSVLRTSTKARASKRKAE